MKRLMGLAGGIALLGALAQVPGGAQDKATSVKEIMDRLHKGANPPLVTLKKELQADQPNWDEIQKTTREFTVLGADLEKNRPPRGPQESWVKLSSQYLADARSMDDGARKKDRETTLTARNALTHLCMSCHEAHKAK